MAKSVAHVAGGAVSRLFNDLAREAGGVQPIDRKAALGPHQASAELPFLGDIGALHEHLTRRSLEPVDDIAVKLASICIVEAVRLTKKLGIGAVIVDGNQPAKSDHVHEVVDIVAGDPANRSRRRDEIAPAKDVRVASGSWRPG